jgi:hypothetical protein
MTDRRYPPPDHDWWRSEMGMGMCRRCGEERLVHKIIDGWGERHYCQVCSHDWTLSRHTTWQARTAVKSGSTGE